MQNMQKQNTKTHSDTTKINATKQTRYAHLYKAIY